MFWRSRQRSLDDLAPIDRPLIHFTNRDHWTLRDAFSGTLVMGATGSGKTSGAGQTIADSFLRAGLGGLVLTAKDDECDTWINYARRAGREESLVIIDDSATHRFNFIEYETAKTPNHAVLTESLIGLFSDIMEAIDNNSGNRDEYWTAARSQLIRNASGLSLLATGTVDLETIDTLIMEAPKSLEEIHQDGVAANHLTMRAMVLAESKKQTFNEVQLRELEMIRSYWLNEFPSLADRTRTSIVSTFRAATDLLNRGLLWQLFSTDTNTVPELSREGIIFIINLPVKTYHETGLIAQVLFKYLWQRSMEQPYHGRNPPRPVFLWADEYQSFVVTNDALFQSTARSKEIATVYMTQNLPSLYNAMGGDQAKSAVESIIGNLCTYIFHGNGDNATNQWASEKIGQVMQYRYSTTSSKDDDHPGPSVSTSQDRDYQISPHSFTILANGGPRNDFLVEGILFQTGRVWHATGKNHITAKFPQKLGQ